MAFARLRGWCVFGDCVVWGNRGSPLAKTHTEHAKPLSKRTDRHHYINKDSCHHHSAQTATRRPGTRQGTTSSTPPRLRPYPEARRAQRRPPPSALHIFPLQNRAEAHREDCRIISVVSVTTVLMQHLGAWGPPGQQPAFMIHRGFWMHCQ